jgi:uncharacterized protein YoxC
VESFLVIAQILALLCLSAMCLYLIAVLVRVRNILINMESDLKEMATRALPVLDNLEFITARVKTITESIDDQVAVVRDSLSSIKRVADNVVDLERRIQDRMEGPILETVGFVAALFKGFRTFFERFRSL